MSFQNNLNSFISHAKHYDYQQHMAKDGYLSTDYLIALKANITNDLSRWDACFTNFTQEGVNSIHPVHQHLFNIQ
jgi:hypothetical protein